MMWLDNRPQGIKEDSGSYPNYRDWAEQYTSFAHVAAYTGAAFTLTESDEPERIIGARTTANFHDVMGIEPILGRRYTPAHEQVGQDAVVLLSHGLWQTKYGDDPGVIGRTIVLNGVAHEILGVMPPELRVPSTAQLWKPLAPTDGQRNQRASFWLPVIGRLKPGVPLQQAQTEMSGLADRLAAAYPMQAGFESCRPRTPARRWAGRRKRWQPAHAQRTHRRRNGACVRAAGGGRHPRADTLEHAGRGPRLPD